MGRQAKLRKQRRVGRGGLPTMQLQARLLGGTWRDLIPSKAPGMPLDEAIVKLARQVAGKSGTPDVFWHDGVRYVFAR